MWSHFAIHVLIRAALYVSEFVVACQLGIWADHTANNDCNQDELTRKHVSFSLLLSG